MKKNTIYTAVFGMFSLFLFFYQPLQAQSYRQIHNNAVVVDTHNDILTSCIYRNVSFDQDLTGITQSDLGRWKKGGLDVQLFSVWCSGEQKDPYAWANREMDTLDAVVKRNPDKIVLVKNSKELLAAVKQHKLAAMFGVEGGHMIEDNLDYIDSLYNRGAKYLTLTWNNSNDWATSALKKKKKKDLPHKGLTAFGKKVVKRMNKLGMIVDVSHVGEQTFWDVINTTTKPIIASHSSVYALCPHYRNLKDDQIKAIAKNNGVIQINFYSGYIDSTYEHKRDLFFERHKTEKDSLINSGMGDWPAEEFLFKKYKDENYAMRPSFDLLIEHIAYIVDLVGVDYVGLGSDFDGVNSTPQHMDDVTSYRLITQALVNKGYGEKDIDKILGGNFIRVLKANEK